MRPGYSRKDKLPKRNHAIIMIVGSMEVSHGKLIRVCKQLGYDHNAIISAIPNLYKIGMLEKSGSVIKLTEKGKDKYLRLYREELANVRIEWSKGEMKNG